MVAGGPAHIAEGIFAESLADADTARTLRAVRSRGEQIISILVQPTAAKITPQHQFVPFPDRRVRIEFGLQFARAVFAFEADRKTVLGIFEGIAAGIPMQIDARIHHKYGGAIGLHEFERTGFGHVPFDACAGGGI